MKTYDYLVRKNLEEATLKDYGKLGWELVAVNYIGMYSTEYYFKRELVDVPVSAESYVVPNTYKDIIPFRVEQSSTLVAN